MITPQQAIARLISNNELFYDGMTDLMHQIMSSQVMPEQIATILTELRVKVGATSGITAAAAVMHEFASKVPVKNGSGLVDIAGTGGDGARTFNISTAAMFVATAVGAKVVKRDGRSMSSSNGVADVMRQTGTVLNVMPEQVAEGIDRTGIDFMFAPNHHSIMRYVAPVRRASGFRSIFNTLDPLTSPTDAPNQLLGVFHIDLCDTPSRVLQQLGSEHVLVVRGEDGLDEITITDKTRAVELRDGTVREYDLSPANYEVEIRRNLDDIKVANSREPLLKIRSVLDGEYGTTQGIVLLSAAAALYADNVVPSLTEGIDTAGEAIDSGKAKAKKGEFVAFTKQLA